MKYFYFFPLFILISYVLTGCGFKKNGQSKSYINEEGMVWNTVFHITYAGPESLKDSIRTVFDEVGHSLSVFDSASLVSRVNKSLSSTVDTDFARVYEMAKKINKISEGSFDPTLSPLITAWGFGPGHTPTADTLRIDSLLEITGINKTSLNGLTLTKSKKEISFNFSAIAKGYGCDRVAEMFRRNGVTDYLIEVGGEIAAGGKSNKGKEWRISIDRPIVNRGVTHDSQLVVKITDCGLATSGNYRNFHYSGLSRFGHTISPTTGRPIQTDVLSSTVIAPTSMEADALATAFMVTGSVRAISIADSLNIPIMLICPDSVIFSRQFEKYLVSP